MSDVWKSRLTKFNQLLQIIAILVAAVWAVWTFNQNTLPGLKQNFSVGLEVEKKWFEERGTCIYFPSLKIKNNSKLFQKITKIIYHAAWVPYPETPKSGEFSLVDFGSIAGEQVELKRQSALALDYPPGAEFWETFEILSKPVEGEVLCIQADAFSNDELVGTSVAWTASCDPVRTKKHNKANSSDAKSRAAN